MSDHKSQAGPTLALIVVITLVTAALVVFTDMNLVLRGVIAVVAGVIAAAITSAVLGSRSRKRTP